MKLPSRFFGRSLDAELHALPAPGKVPTAGEVLGEIGCLLVVHLAVALAVVLALRVWSLA